MKALWLTVVTGYAVLVSITWKQNQSAKKEGKCGPELPVKLY